MSDVSGRIPVGFPVRALNRLDHLVPAGRIGRVTAIDPSMFYTVSFWGADVRALLHEVRAMTLDDIAAHFESTRTDDHLPKIQLIKAVREVTALSLYEAKTLIERAESERGFRDSKDLARRVWGLLTGGPVPTDVIVDPELRSVLDALHAACVAGDGDPYPIAQAVLAQLTTYGYDV